MISGIYHPPNVFSVFETFEYSMGEPGRILFHLFLVAFISLFIEIIE